MPDATPVRLRRLAPLGVAAAIILHTLMRPAIQRARASEVPARPPASLRVVSWNLRNYPDEHDRARLQERLRDLDPQLLALQEIRDPFALAQLRPGWRFVVTEHGGRHGPQRLAIGWDPAAVEVLDVREHSSLTMGGRVRPALSAYVRARGGPDFHLMVVHLKATPRGHALRREQWSRLARLVEGRLAGGPADDDLLLVGDFNATGEIDNTPAAERQALSEALAPSGVRPWDIKGGCTAYWDGARRDHFWEPSALDLVWSAGLSEVAQRKRVAWPGTHCAHHRCTAFRASDDYPEPDLQHVSDHCPVVLDLPRLDDDP